MTATYHEHDQAEFSYKELPRGQAGLHWPYQKPDQASR